MEQPKDSRQQPVAAAYCTSDDFMQPVKRLCLRKDEAALSSAALAFGPAASPLAASDFLAESLTEVSSEVPHVHTPPSRPAPSLDDLGEDLLLHMLRLAHPTAWDLSRMACVSRTWRRVCYNKIFWTKLRIGTGSMRPGVEALAARCGELVELHVDDPRCELHVLHPIVVACGSSLRRVVINCDRDMTSRNEASICSILWIVSLYCKKVDTVELLSDGKAGGFGYLENKAMWYLTTGFRSLRSFACLCREGITKQALYLMVIAWRELTCLRIHCGELAEDDLMSLKKCYLLRMLELVGGDLGKLVGQQPQQEHVPQQQEQHQMLRQQHHRWLQQQQQPHLQAQPDMMGANTQTAAAAAATAAAATPPAAADNHAITPTGPVPAAPVEGKAPTSAANAGGLPLQVVVLSDMKCNTPQIVQLCLLCPLLRRVLVSRSTWARGAASVQEERQRLREYQLLQSWLLARRGVQLFLEE